MTGNIQSTAPTKASSSRLLLWLCVLGQIVIVAIWGWQQGWLTHAAPHRAAPVTTESFVQQADARTEPLHNALAEQSQQIEALQQQLDTLPPPPTEALEQLDHRIHLLESAVQTLQAEQSQGIAAMLAWDQLRQAIARGTPYDTAYQIAEQAFAAYPQAAAALEPLREYAALGVPTLKQLRKSFAAALIQGPSAKTAENDSLLQKVGRNLASLVHIRKVGPNHPGTDDGSRLARAEALLAQSKLAEAMREVEQLSNASSDAFAAWLAHAQAHINALQAMQAIKNTMMSQASRPTTNSDTPSFQEPQP